MDHQWYKRSELYTIVVGAAVTVLDGVFDLKLEGELLTGMWAAISAYCLSRGYIKGKAAQ